jgi:tetratricopeptide (TPR) repeat protein
MGAPGYQTDKARNQLLSQDISGAIISYSGAARNSSNAAILSEYAYALALGGYYDAALIQLDKAKKSDAKSWEVNFYASQVYGLMGYEDLSKEFWSPFWTKRAPSWISAKAGELKEKYKRKSGQAEKMDRAEMVSFFKEANELASRGEYFRSIGLFRRIIASYPKESLPYVGYSIALEKMGAFESSSQNISKAMSLLGSDAASSEKRTVLAKRLEAVNKVSSKWPKDRMMQPYAPETRKESQTQMMSYAGGMVSSAFSNVNLRFGYSNFKTGNAAIDFSFGNNAAASSTYYSIGVSTYSRLKVLMLGIGVNGYSQNGGDMMGTFKGSLGISAINRSGRSSFEVFLDVHQPFTAKSPGSVGISIGSTIYFGKRHKAK